MASRLELHNKLLELFECENVYYQPPSTLQMNYPAIRYSKSQIRSRFADDTTYSLMRRYEIIVIDQKPDNPVIEKILSLPLTSFDRHYVANNLNHDVITIFY